MTTKQRYLLGSIIFVLMLILQGCGDGSSTNGYGAGKGIAAKGPFVQGSKVTVYQLTKKGHLDTRHQVKGKVIDNKGNYKIQSINWRGMSEVTIYGKYYNENSGQYNKPIYLSALINPAIGITNVNVLTHLVAKRARILMKAGKTAYRAKVQAEREIMGFFGINSNPNQLNPIDNNGKYSKANAELMRISAAISSKPELLAKLVIAFNNDGKILKSDPQEKKTLLDLDRAVRRVNFENCAKHMVKDGLMQEKKWKPIEVSKLPYIQKYTIGGQYSNLKGMLIIKNSDGEKITLNGNQQAHNGTFQFSHKFIGDKHYAISAIQLPNRQDCDISHGNGVINENNVSNITIECRPQSHIIGGHVVSLRGQVSLDLNLITSNGTKKLESIVVSKDGNFTFAEHKDLTVGAIVEPKIKQQPVGQTCYISGSQLGVGNHFVIHDNQSRDAYENVFAVTCYNTISGHATGITREQLNLRIEGHHRDGTAFSYLSSINAGSNSFTITKKAEYGDEYNITIQDTYNAKWRTCTPKTIHIPPITGNVNDLNITCIPRTYALHVQVSNIPNNIDNEDVLHIKLNNDEELIANKNGTYTFNKHLYYLSNYYLKLVKNPKHYYVSQSHGDTISDTTPIRGNIDGSDKTILLHYTAKKYPIRIIINQNSQNMVSDTIGTGEGKILEVKYLNHTRDMTSYSSGTTIGNGVPYGHSYKVSLGRVSYWATCSLLNSEGVAAEENNVSIVCQRKTFHPQLIVRGLENNNTKDVNVTISVPKGGHGNEDINQTISISKNNTYTFDGNMTYGQFGIISFKTREGVKCKFDNGGTYRDEGMRNVYPAKTPLKVILSCKYDKYNIYINTNLKKVPPRGVYTIKNSINGDKIKTDKVDNITFKRNVDYGYEYNLTITEQPNGQQCALQNNTGVVTGNVNNIIISCDDINYTIGGTVNGLISDGNITIGLKARKDASDPNGHIEILNIDKNGQYNFKKDGNISIGSSAMVILLSQPQGQKCTLKRNGYTKYIGQSRPAIVDANGSSHVAIGSSYWDISQFPARDITDFDINCTNNKYGISGRLTSPSSWMFDESIIISLNNQYNSTIKRGSTFFNFGYHKLAYGDDYNITVVSEPSYVTCSIPNGEGRITGEINDINLSCQMHQYSIGGKISGIKHQKGVDITLGNETLHVTQDGNFVFTKQYVHGDYYNIIAYGKHYGHYCSIDNHAGNVADHNVSVDINCTYNNTAPFANGYNEIVDENSSVEITPSVSDNDDDPLSSLIVVTQPSHGSVSEVNSTTVKYTPDKNYYGDDNFTYKVNDGELDSNIATVTIFVRNMQDRPVAEDANVTVNANVTTTIDLIAHDPNGDSLSYAIQRQPVHGKINSMLIPNHAHYTPDSNYTGQDSFTFKVSDGTYWSNEATVYINVSNNHKPTAVNDTAQTNRNTAVAINILANDSDTDGTLDVTSIELSSQIHGTATLLNSGQVEFTPESYYMGEASFKYRVKDNSGDWSNIADVNITVKNNTCWETISKPVLDINQSLAAELPSSVIDSSDKLYVTWTEGKWAESYYYVKNFDPVTNTWTTLGNKINSSKAASWPRAIIKLNPNDSYPYIYFYEDNKGHTVKKWDGSNWNSIYTDNTGGKNYNMDINQSSGYPTIVYQSNENVYSFKSYDGSAWNQTFNKLDQHHSVYGGKLLLNGAKPYMIYTYTTNYGHSAVRDYNGTDWVYIGALESNTSERQAVCASPIIDKNGNLVVAYVEKGDPRHRSIKPNVYVKRYDGTNWTVIGDKINGSTTVSTEGNLGSGSNHHNQCVSLAENKTSGEIFVAWSHKANNKVTIYTTKFDGTSWSEAAKPIEELHSVRAPSLTIDSEGKMNISVMYDSTPNQTDTDDIKVYHCKPKNGGVGPT